MQTYQLVGTALIVAGLFDIASALWIPSRIADERQRTIVRLALISSGAVIIALGGMFLAGLVGTGPPPTAERP
jgi:uncharacterized membrane protein HdeD (DUF308 family)